MRISKRIKKRNEGYPLDSLPVDKRYCDPEHKKASGMASGFKALKNALFKCKTTSHHLITPKSLVL